MPHGGGGGIRHGKLATIGFNSPAGAYMGAAWVNQDCHGPIERLQGLQDCLVVADSIRRSRFGRLGKETVVTEVLT